MPKKHAKTEKHRQPNKPIKLVLAHANWCGHCQHLMPEWKIMKQNLKNDPVINSICDIKEYESAHPKFQSNIDNINNSLTGEKLDVAGFPTIVIVKDNELHKYNGNRTEPELTKWAKIVITGKPHEGPEFKSPFLTGGKKRRTIRKKSRSWALW